MENNKIDLEWEELYNLNLKILTETNTNKTNIHEEMLINLIKIFDQMINSKHKKEIQHIENKFIKINVNCEPTQKDESKMLTYQYTHRINHRQSIRIMHYQLRPHSNLEELAIIYYGPDFPVLIDKRYNLAKNTYKINNGEEQKLDSTQMKILFYELQKSIENLKKEQEFEEISNSYVRSLKK